MDRGAVRQLPEPRRHLAIDERGTGLRATWHLDFGFVNLSLWRGDRCVETFHLTPAEAGRLVGFLVSGLAAAVPEPGPLLKPLPPLSDEGDGVRSGLDRYVANLRGRLADIVEHTAISIRR